VNVVLGVTAEAGFSGAEEAGRERGGLAIRL